MARHDVNINNQEYDILLCFEPNGWYSISDPNTGKKVMLHDIPEEFKKEFPSEDNGRPPRNTNYYKNCNGVIICKTFDLAKELIVRFDFKNNLTFLNP